MSEVLSARSAVRMLNHGAQDISVALVQGAGTNANRCGYNGDNVAKTAEIVHGCGGLTSDAPGPMRGRPSVYSGGTRFYARSGERESLGREPQLVGDQRGRDPRVRGARHGREKTSTASSEANPRVAALAN